MYLVICCFTTRRLLISHPDYASKVVIVPVWGQVQRVFHQNRISTLYYREGLSRNLGLADFSPKWKPCIVFERHHREDFSDESCAGKLVVELLSQYFIFDLSLKSINNVKDNLNAGGNRGFDAISSFIFAVRQSTYISAVSA